MYTSEAINSVIEIAQKKADGYTYPVFIFDDNGRPDLIATAVILELDDKCYLVSAAHVFKEILKVASVPYLATNSRYLRVSGKYILSEGDGRDDFDIGFFQLPPSFVSKHKLQVIKFEMLRPYEFFSSFYIVLIHGYPNSKNKQSKALRGSTMFSISSYAYSGMINENFLYWDEIGKSKDIHTCMTYGKNKLKNSPVFPRGISGGGLWVVPDMKKPKEIYLDSIVIEFYKNYQVIFSTKIANIIAFIKLNI